MSARNNFYKAVAAFITARPGIDTKRTIAAFEKSNSARNVKHALYYLKTRGKLMQLPNGTWSAPETKTLVGKGNLQNLPRELSSIEAGIAIADLIQALREENKKLKQELEEWKELTDDYDRLKEDNRVLSERVTELTTRFSASNSKTIKF